jgi:hypothetical protein
MAILTRDRLTILTETRLGRAAFSQSINEAKLENKASATTTIFLSHSHDDLANGDLDKVIVALRSVGVRVYIDSQDASMPPFTNAETAHRIKQAIKNNKKFVLLATNRAVNSKWCNWELGYGDAHKYDQHIALLPLADQAATWQGSEYLRIYPRIEESTVNPGNYVVIFPNDHTITLSQWLKS